MALDTKNRPGSQYDDGWKSKQSHTPSPEGLQNQFDAPSATDENLPANHPSRKALSPDDLQNAEQSSGTPDTGKTSQAEVGLFKDSKQDSEKKGFLGKLSGRQKAVGGGVVGAFVVTVVSIFMLFTPILRLEHYLQTINQRAFAFAASAVEARLGHLMERYMVSYTINLQRCGAVRSIDCRAPVGGAGMTNNLFRAWRDVRMEAKLFDHFGLEVRSHQWSPQDGGRRWRLYDKRGTPIHVSNDRLTGGAFEGGRRQFGREMNRFLRTETRWYQVMQRKSIRKYLSRKHDVQFWCFLACKTRDNIDNKVADAKTRYRYKFIDRFIYPFSGKLGLYMDCVASGGQGGRCSTDSLRRQGVDRSRMPHADAERIISSINANPNKRLSVFAAEEIALKIFKRQISQRSLAAIPVAGQIYFAVWAFNAIDNAQTALEEGKLSQMAADINARQYLEYYQAIRSDNDAMKNGELSLEEIGLLVSEMEGAEQSLVYQAYNNTPESSLALFNSTARAQTTNNGNDYLCLNGQPIPAGDLVCEEKKIARTFAIERLRENAIVDLGADVTFGIYQRTLKIIADPIIRGVDWLASAVLGTALSAAMGGLEHVPGVSGAIEWMKDKGSELFTWMLGKIFPLPVQPDSPGREKYDGLEAGADVAASEFGKGGFTDDGKPYGLGAIELNEQDVAAIYEEYLAQQDYEFQYASLLDRITSTEHRNSLVSQLIHRVPSTPSSALQNIAVSPMRAVSGIAKFFSLLVQPSVSAQSSAQQQMAINPFGTTRYGYPIGHPALTLNPEQLTPEFCLQAKEAWETSMTENEVTGFDEYSTANPCLLELAAIEAGSGLFVDDDYDFDGLLTGTGANN